MDQHSLVILEGKHTVVRLVAATAYPMFAIFAGRFCRMTHGIGGICKCIWASINTNAPIAAKDSLRSVTLRIT